MDKYEYSHCLKVYNKGFRHPWKTDGALCFGHMPCPDISSIIFVPKPGWYPIWSNYTVGRACGLLNQHGIATQRLKKCSGGNPFVFTWNAFHIWCHPWSLETLWKAYFRSSPDNSASLQLGKKFPLLPCWVHYCHVGSTIGHALWTRPEHDSFGNTKSKWS